MTKRQFGSLVAIARGICKRHARRWGRKYLKDPALGKLKKLRRFTLALIRRDSD